MIVPFDQLPEHSRVWIYPSNRPFTKEERQTIQNKAQIFLAQWTAHGADLQAAIDLPHNRFIVLGLNEAIQSASGCSIDASVHFIQSLEKELGLSLLDKMNVTYRNKNTIDHIPLNTIPFGKVQPPPVGMPDIFNGYANYTYFIDPFRDPVLCTTA